MQGSGLRTNADLDGDALAAFATPDIAAQKLLAQAAEMMRMSARGYTRILRVARTIADLGNAADVGRMHITEALRCRRQPPRNLEGSAVFCTGAGTFWRTTRVGEQRELRCENTQRAE